MALSGQPPAYARLGLRVVSAGEGSATVELEDGAATDASGDVHFAVIAALAQAAIEQALRSTVDAGHESIEFDLKVNRLRPLASGSRAHATASVVHRGRRTALAECRITAGDVLVATATGTTWIRARA